MKRQLLLQKRKSAADLVGNRSSSQEKPNMKAVTPIWIKRQQLGKGKRKGSYFCLKAEEAALFLLGEKKSRISVRIGLNLPFMGRSREMIGEIKKGLLWGLVVCQKGYLYQAPFSAMPFPIFGEQCKNDNRYLLNGGYPIIYIIVHINQYIVIYIDSFGISAERDCLLKFCHSWQKTNAKMYWLAVMIKLLNALAIYIDEDDSLK